MHKNFLLFAGVAVLFGIFLVLLLIFLKMMGMSDEDFAIIFLVVLFALYWFKARVILFFASIVALIRNSKKKENDNEGT